MVSQSKVREDTVFWYNHYKAAKLAAKKNKKPIILYFTGSDWCVPCKNLEHDFFDNQEFINAAHNFVLLKIDYPRNIDLLKEGQAKENKMMLDKFNPDKIFPVIIALKPNGKEIDRISGYSPLRVTTYHFDFIHKIL